MCGWERRTHRKTILEREAHELAEQAKVQQLEEKKLQKKEAARDLVVKTMQDEINAEHRLREQGEGGLFMIERFTCQQCCVFFVSERHFTTSPFNVCALLPLSIPCDIFNGSNPKQCLAQMSATTVLLRFDLCRYGILDSASKPQMCMCVCARARGCGCGCGCVSVSVCARVCVCTCGCVCGADIDDEDDAYNEEEEFEAWKGM